MKMLTYTFFFSLMQTTVGYVEAQQHKSVVSVFDLTVVQRLSSFGT